MSYYNCTHKEKHMKISLTAIVSGLAMIAGGNVLTVVVIGVITYMVVK
jgi:branched-subunit amino acid transport protein